MKVGIITDAYESTRIKNLVRYLEERAEVRLHIEENIVLDFENYPFDEDVFFTKGKGYMLLALTRLAEDYGIDSGVSVVNDSRSIWNTMHRFTHCLLLESAGVRVPEYSLGPSGAVPFDSYIVKNIIDQDHLRFLDVLPLFGNQSDEIPPVITAEEAAGTICDDFHLYQRVIESEYEYKVYGIGDELRFYRQVPVARYPNKMETRVPIDEIQVLKKYSESAMRATGLRIASMDFLEENGKFYMTDINPVPNFNYVEDGVEILGDHLLELAR